MLHDLLKEYREKKGLSIEQVAKELNVSPYQIEKWEDGSEIPSSQQIAMLTVLYELPMKVLYKSLKENEAKEYERHQGPAVPHATRIKLAIIAQTAFLVPAVQPVDLGSPTETFVFKLMFTYLPVLLASLWMAYNHRYEQNPTQRKQNTKIEILYCVFQYNLALLGLYFHYPLVAAFAICFVAMYYIKNINPRYMNRNLLNR